MQSFQRRSHAPSLLAKRVRSDEDGSGGIGSTGVNGVFKSPLTQSSNCKRARRNSAARKKYGEGEDDGGDGDRHVHIDSYDVLEERATFVNI